MKSFFYAFKISSMAIAMVSLIAVVSPKIWADGSCSNESCTKEGTPSACGNCCVRKAKFSNKIGSNQPKTPTNSVGYDECISCCKKIPKSKKKSENSSDGK